MTADREGVKLSGNTIRWLNVVMALMSLASMFCAGISWFISRADQRSVAGVIEAEREARRALETRMSVAEALTKRNMDDISSLRTEFLKGVFEINGRLQTIENGVSRLQGKVGAFGTSDALPLYAGFGP